VKQTPSAKFPASYRVAMSDEFRLPGLEVIESIRMQKTTLAVLIDPKGSEAYSFEECLGGQMWFQERIPGNWQEAIIPVGKFFHHPNKPRFGFLLPDLLTPYDQSYIFGCILNPFQVFTSLNPDGVAAKVMTYSTLEPMTVGKLENSSTGLCITCWLDARGVLAAIALPIEKDSPEI
jgi:hypothetical protein